MFPPPDNAKLLAYAAVMALCAGVLWAQQGPAIFKTDVKMVHVLASVKDTKGQLVGILQKSDFEIYDNGARQNIAVFERQTHQPLSIAMLIDTSGSTAKDLKYETDAASRFLKALLANGNPDDQVALFSFDADVTQVRAFTHNYYSLDNALKSVHGSGGTSLYDAIYLAARELESRPGRKVMIVITDGGETTSSNKDIHGPLKETQFADAIVYPLVVMPITNPAGRNTGGEHALIFMAEGTGGHAFFPEAAPELDKAFSDIIQELRTQYFLAYYPTAVPLTKDPFHKLEVKVGRADLQVSARNGYYGEAESADRSPEDPQIAVSPAERKKK